MVSEIDVKKANKLFYDIIAEDYENVDSRRSPVTFRWIKSTLSKLSAKTQGKKILDIGCGNGFVMRASTKCFEQVYGADISLNVLNPIKNTCDGAVCCDVFNLPFKDNTFDVVSCFAVLHHCHSHKNLVAEAHRVLKKGGIFYSDHDLDISFMRNFYILMKLYRFFFDFEQKYLEKNKKITKKTYKLTEFHSEGINSKRIIENLKSAGFKKIIPQRHWLGITDLLTSFLLKLRIIRFRRGFAPLFSVVARK